MEIENEANDMKFQVEDMQSRNDVVANNDETYVLDETLNALELETIEIYVCNYCYREFEG